MEIIAYQIVDNDVIRFISKTNNNSLNVASVRDYNNFMRLLCCSNVEKVEDIYIKYIQVKNS